MVMVAKNHWNSLVIKEEAGQVFVVIGMWCLVCLFNLLEAKQAAWP